MRSIVTSCLLLAGMAVGVPQFGNHHQGGGLFHQDLVHHNSVGLHIPTVHEPHHVDPYKSTHHADPYKTTHHADPYKQSHHADPYNKKSHHADPYNKKSHHADPYNKKSHHADPYNKKSHHADPYKKSHVDPYNSHHEKGYGGHDDHHGHAAPYGFEYEVQDPYYGSSFGHAEQKDGYVTKGSYYVDLPDGRRQTVTYTADEYGYHPVVTYEGEPHYGHQDGGHQDGYHGASAHTPHHGGLGHLTAGPAYH